eukprot:gnl/TRDRNA2_/TRDRNA2_153630_c0_seq1.p1 gnl/TRDRNA2_/TRDRNA2_153630_c0~~gnl/TRDRNA2_/TRDRNA2_153630_c0_seq1.p1  ORF type:complete len:131 (+),score=18.76 gnl/TRDRNA2_/TRDRNA2_153630_c0_seq1:44-436(+)
MGAGWIVHRGQVAAQTPAGQDHNRAAAATSGPSAAGTLTTSPSGSAVAQAAAVPATPAPIDASDGPAPAAGGCAAAVVNPVVPLGEPLEEVAVSSSRSSVADEPPPALETSSPSSTLGVVDILGESLGSA